MRKRCAQTSNKAVLYVHGYVDYFFQTHLADFYLQHGLHFYALDLRRHGRAMRTEQLPNYTDHIDEYPQDVDAAIEVLCAEEGCSGCCSMDIPPAAWWLPCTPTVAKIAPKSMRWS